MNALPAPGELDNIVILTGAGVSAESGIATFRDAGGLWEGHDPMELATPEAFARNPGLIYRFYGERLQKLGLVEPNEAHRAIARLQAGFAGEVFLVTQNVDDLHERGGSDQVCHMHGQLRQVLCGSCGSRYPVASAYDGDSHCLHCEQRGALRPDVVWFGEIPYHMEQISQRLQRCDLFVAIGTSGAVYPAAGFVAEARAHGAITVEINLQRSDVADHFHHHLEGPATEQVPALARRLLG